MSENVIEVRRRRALFLLFGSLILSTVASQKMAMEAYMQASWNNEKYRVLQRPPNESNNTKHSKSCEFNLNILVNLLHNVVVTATAWPGNPRHQSSWHGTDTCTDTRRYHWHSTSLCPTLHHLLELCLLVGTAFVIPVHISSRQRERHEIDDQPALCVRVCVSRQIKKRQVQDKSS